MKWWSCGGNGGHRWGFHHLQHHGALRPTATSLRQMDEIGWSHDNEPGGIRTAAAYERCPEALTVLRRCHIVWKRRWEWRAWEFEWNRHRVTARGLWTEVMPKSWQFKQPEDGTTQEQSDVVIQWVYFKRGIFLLLWSACPSLGIRNIQHEFKTKCCGRSAAWVIATTVHRSVVATYDEMKILAWFGTVVFFCSSPRRSAPFLMDGSIDHCRREMRWGKTMTWPLPETIYNDDHDTIACRVLQGLSTALYWLTVDTTIFTWKQPLDIETAAWHDIDDNPVARQLGLRYLQTTRWRMDWTKEEFNCKCVFTLSGRGKVRGREVFVSVKCREVSSPVSEGWK